MRKGSNPEKVNPKKIQVYKHIVFIPIYIPNMKEEYFKGQLKVLEKCLESLFISIDNNTRVVLLSNNCCEKVEDYLISLRKHKSVFDIILSRENLGKVKPAVDFILKDLAEYVTVTDADVIFGQFWEKAVFDVFDNVSEACAVSPSPAPHLAFHGNVSLFMNMKLLRMLKKGDFIESDSLKLFEEGIMNENIFRNCKNNHYIFQKGMQKYVVGCGHFCTTYRSSYLIPYLKENNDVKYVFKNGLEHDYLDVAGDKYGGIRLSCIKSHVYHMGNIFEEKNLDCRINHYIENIKTTRPKIAQYKKNAFYSFKQRLLSKMRKYL